jgi:hypothetical protein
VEHYLSLFSVQAWFEAINTLNARFMFSSFPKPALLLWIIIAIAACSKREEPKAVARVGSLKITADEFQRRFELTPRLKPFQDVEQAKALFLGSLIAEKLLAEDAAKAGLAESARTQAFLEQIHREAAIEELYIEKVAAKIHREGKKFDKQEAGAEFTKYFKQMMVGKKTEVPSPRLKYLTERLEEAFRIGEDTTAFIRKLNPSPMSESEFSQAGQSLEANLNETLVTFDGGAEWTIKEFLRRLSVGAYHLDFSNQKKFRLSLREAVITMIEHEYVYQNAVQEGLHKSPAVAAEVAMWRESIAAQMHVQKLLSHVSQPQDEQETQNLTDEQLRLLTDKLLTLSNAHRIEINPKTLRELQVSNAGLLLLKKHFPGRMVVPLSLPLEHLTAWQEEVAKKMGHLAAN